MYHVELRKFPHSFWRFNLSEEELFGSLLASWVVGDWVDAGEKRWDPREASLTVVEGPELAMQELAMGRGWRNATRRGEDVTARVLAQARERVAQTGARPGGGAGRRGDASASAGAGARTVVGASRTSAIDSLGKLLGPDAEALLSLWKVARERHPEQTPSECLARAEAMLRSL